VAGTTYLFGTIHLGIPAEELPAAVHTALRSSEVAVFEANLEDLNPFGMMTLAMFPEGESLETRLPLEDWPRLVEAVSGSVPESMLRTYRPWFLFMVLTQSMLPTTEPMDLSLQEAARQNLSSLEYLETLDFQMEVLSAIPEEAWLDQIMEWVDDRSTVLAEFEQMIAGYRSGNVEDVIAMTFQTEDMARWPAIFDTLIYGRNATWVPLVEGYIGRGGVFIAVGLAHLVGDRSVIALLRERGYTVTRVEAP
jgi:uncharacterized protein YbaP (TraB family)